MQKLMLQIFLTILVKKQMGTFKITMDINIWLLVQTDESKDTRKKYGELWSKTRDVIRSIISNSDDYDKNYIKFKFNWDDDLPLQK